MIAERYMLQVGRRQKEPKTSMGKWVRQVRTDAGLSVEAFAAEVGVNRVTVHSWESGAHGFRHASIRKIQSKFKNAPPLPGDTCEANDTLPDSPVVDRHPQRIGGSVHTFEGDEVARDIDDIGDRTTRRRARYAAQEAIAKVLEESHPSEPGAERGTAARHR